MYWMVAWRATLPRCVFRILYHCGVLIDRCYLGIMPFRHKRISWEDRRHHGRLIKTPFHQNERAGALTKWYSLCHGINVRTWSVECEIQNPLGKAWVHRRKQLLVSCYHLFIAPRRRSAVNIKQACAKLALSRERETKRSNLPDDPVEAMLSYGDCWSPLAMICHVEWPPR